MNFCFVINDLLSASSQPGKNRRAKYYFDLYRENNIKVLLSLYKKIELPPEYQFHFRTYHFEYVDLINDPREFDQVVDIIIGHLKKREASNINCEAGISQSAVLLTGVLMKFYRISYHEAFKRIAEHRYPVEDDEAVSHLLAYESYLRVPSQLSV